MGRHQIIALDVSYKTITPVFRFTHPYPNFNGGFTSVEDILLIHVFSHPLYDIINSVINRTETHYSLLIKVILVQGVFVTRCSSFEYLFHDISFDYLCL